MSISDRIVVMRDGVIEQTGKPQEVYDNPVNLFVARFLGTPAINVFQGTIKDAVLYIGDVAILDTAGVADQEVYVGVRPEGLRVHDDGPLSCRFIRVEVMGRDVSIMSAHEASLGATIRAIISAKDSYDAASGYIRFTLKPDKVFLFRKEAETRIPM